MIENDIKQIVRKLRRYEINIQDIPEEMQFNMDIIKEERKFHLRKSLNRGFDIIKQEFFVEEEIFYKDSSRDLKRDYIKTTFKDLEPYYNFLEGDIYTNSCYQYYDYKKDEAFIKKKIDIKKLKKRSSFITQTLDDFPIDISQNEIKEEIKKELNTYEEAEKTKELCKKWIAKFDTCKNYEEFSNMAQDYKKSQLQNIVDLSFFFSHYIFKNTSDKDRFDIIMKAMSTGILKWSIYYDPDKIVNGLCSIYDPNEVINNYKYSLGSKSTIYKHKRMLKEYVDKLKNKEINFYSHSYFDKKTHFYCEEWNGFQGDSMWQSLVSIYRYFDNFEEFIEYRKGNLKSCDLSAAIKLEKDFSKYEIDEKTKLPLKTDNLVFSIKKGFKNGKFYVEQEWRNPNDCLIKKKELLSTLYFFDFVHFLKGDLSYADLLFCDGLANINNETGINFTGAKMTSHLCNKFNIPYDTFELNQKMISSFEQTEKNEEETALSTLNKNTHELSLDYAHTAENQRVDYITDLHLMHRLKNAKCKSKNDVIYVIQNIVNTIVAEAGELLLIGGDVASDFTIFKLFITHLRKTLDNRRNDKTNVIFILGNHELWGFAGKTINEITCIYRNIIEENSMYFIQNDLLYKDSSNNFKKLSFEQLQKYDNSQLREVLRKARLVILGGIGFSGYNTAFNANNGIYQSTVDRNVEIKETAKFEKLYHCMKQNIKDKNVIIFTHTSIRDWCKKPEYQADFVYISGHDHRNNFHDDGEYRIYSDNQIGYHNENPHLKNFLMDNEYDYFSDYADGIYEISDLQYKEFYRGKNIQMSFTREVNILYMLKKMGYYCFIHQTKSNSLTLLNGGARKKLDEIDIHYYYNHMDTVISYIKKPLDKYTNIQHKISKEIQKIGGSGHIHGCIIDIDYYNHIYVNPVDMTITSYWASDIINKTVYPDIPSLLKGKCPNLYNNYLKVIKMIVKIH